MKQLPPVERPGPAKKPCISCPYRRDVPAGVWSENEYMKLPAYDGSTLEQLVKGGTGVFFCHQRTGNLCSGWVGCHDMQENAAIRFAAAAGLHVAPETFDYESPVPLFESGLEACLHGLSGIEEPGEDAQRMIDILSKKIGTNEEAGMKILNLHMDVRWSARVGWTDEKGERYSVPLETDGGGHFGGGDPVRPFRVRETKPMGHKVAKRYGSRQPPENTTGENKTSRFDSEAKAYAATVAEALRRAEAEGLYEKAVVAEEERQRAKEAKAHAEHLQRLRDDLKPLLDHEDDATKLRASLLHDGPDEALHNIWKAFR